VHESPTFQMLLKAHGWMLSASTTAKLLGFASTDALRLARSRGRLPIQMFTVDGRRGWFAMAEDVARWLDETTAATRSEQVQPENSRNKSTVP